MHDSNLPWYRLAIDEVIRHLETDPEKGLAQEEAARRLRQFGPNELVERAGKPIWRMILDQLTEVMVIILLIAAIISFLLGEHIDAAVIMAIVVLNTILGFTQEYKAEQAMAALKKLAVPTVRVRRDGHVVEISARELVPGDIVLLEAGALVPADGRIIESYSLKVQEASLTGESEPVEKSVAPIDRDEVALGDMRNMVFMGTAVTYGRGVVVVTATGMHTELGKIADMIQTVEQEPTPLQKRLAQLGKGLAVAALVIVALVFGLGVLRGEDMKEMFLVAISMAVAAVPEGLPAVVTIALALGAQRMLARQALIRKLPAVETLGSVTVICSDKTGTLTENRMTVAVLDVAGKTLDVMELQHKRRGRLFYAEEEPHELNSAALLTLIGGALCNDAILERDESKGQWRALGDPTEGALVLAAAAFGLEKASLASCMPRVAEVPFTSERKRMTTVHTVDLPCLRQHPILASFLDLLPSSVAMPPYLAFTKGAVDGLLTLADRIWIDGEVHPLDDVWRQRVRQAHDQWAEKGMRVLGVALRGLDQAPDPHTIEQEIEQNLVFVGMVGMIDPPRPEVKDAVATCRQAGIRPIMITGDHPLTARFIAQQLGIASDDRVITGVELERMSSEQLQQAVRATSVFARVSPEHKLRIVDALQNQDHIVAMTGDGVNDAPALTKADIGVAMGITGTDVAKEAAEMVLLDDNFATIVAAVEEGRVIYDNIRKFIKYTLASNTGEILVMLIGPFLGLPLPLLPLQILWINLVTDGVPGLALTVEPGEPDVMKRPPVKPNENIFARGLGVDILWIGILMGFISLAAGLWGWLTGSEAWQTMIFTTLTLAQMGNAMALRSNRESLFQIGVFSNPMMLGAVLVTFLLQLALIYIPFFQTIFDTKALTATELAISLLLSLIVFIAVEIKKALARRGAGSP
ncbi:MAG TPA: cation-translocating P-type ATPase [Anaerolineae bacterium]|nr:cation-translocating P-type ATPase [Anaerolineae bacterium]